MFCVMARALFVHLRGGCTLQLALSCEKQLHQGIHYALQTVNICKTRSLQ